MNERRPILKSVIIITVCVLVTAGSGVWIYFTQFAASKFKVSLHRAVGNVMAEETSRLLDHRGKVVIISIEAARAPELSVQIEEFEAALKRIGNVKVDKSYHLETEGKAKYGVGSGLSARRFVRIVNKNLDADAFVSFVGVPDMSEDDIKELKKTPKFVAETRSAEKLQKLFQKKVVHVAVASRFTFPAPIEGRPHTLRQWFDKYFQVVTAENAKALLGADAIEN